MDHNKFSSLYSAAVVNAQSGEVYSLKDPVEPPEAANVYVSCCLPNFFFLPERKSLLNFVSEGIKLVCRINLDPVYTEWGTPV